jgi:hypothetical protein
VYEPAGPAAAGPYRAARGAGGVTGSPHRLGHPHVTSILCWCRCSERHVERHAAANGK